MKIAITGKGGVGKSTLSSALAHLLALEGQIVLAVDADPDANLASALGMSGDLQKTIIPISRQSELIEERTGAKVNQYGQMFKLNPQVSDIADSFATTMGNISLLVLGAVKRGGGGCACPENVLLRALVRDLVLHKNQSLILDMEAGIEHLGRATVDGVDLMIIVVEPGEMSIDCALRIIPMAGEIGLKQVAIVGSKVRDSEDFDFIKESFPHHPLLGIISYSEDFSKADRPGTTALKVVNGEIQGEYREILHRIKDFNR